MKQKIVRLEAGEPNMGQQTWQQQSTASERQDFIIARDLFALWFR